MERRQIGKGSQAPRNNKHNSEFLGFMFTSYIPDLQLKKTATLKCQQAQTKKKASKSALQPKDQKRGILARQTLGEKKHSTPDKHHRKNGGPTYANKSQVGNLDFCYQAVTKHPSTLVMLRRPCREPSIHLRHLPHHLPGDPDLTVTRDTKWGICSSNFSWQ